MPQLSLEPFGFVLIFETVAFTYSNNPKFSPLIHSSKEAVLSVIKLCRPEVYICDIQDIASEIIESYEYENKPLKAIGNVCGPQTDA